MKSPPGRLSLASGHKADLLSGPRTLLVACRVTEVTCLRSRTGAGPHERHVTPRTTRGRKHVTAGRRFLVSSKTRCLRDSRMACLGGFLHLECSPVRDTVHSL